MSMSTPSLAPAAEPPPPPHPPTPSAESWPSKLARRPYTLATVILALAMSSPVWHRPDQAWLRVFVLAGQRLIRGEDIYRWTDGFVYPPASALLAAPFALMGQWFACATWYVLSYSCLVGLARLAWRSAGGAPRLGREPSARREHLAVLVGCAVALRYALNALSHTQTDPLIGLLLMAGCLAAVRGRFVPAAIAWGAGASFKGPPLLMAVYLLWRRRFAAAVLMIAVAVAINLLPNLTSRTPKGNPLWMIRWARLYARPMGMKNDPGKWFNTPLNNHSIPGMVGRLMNGQLQVNHEGRHGAVVVLVDRPDPPPVQLTRRITLGAEIAVVVVAGLASLFARLRQSRSTKPSPDSAPSLTALECSMGFLLTLLLSPMTSRSHLVVLFLPAFCLARAALLGRGGARGVAVAWAALAFAVIPNAVGLFSPRSYRIVEDMTEYAGTITLSVVALLLACAYHCMLATDAGPTPAATPAPGSHSTGSAAQT